MDMEKRFTKFPIETRADSSGNHVLSGYAIVFNQPSEFMGFREYIDPNALSGVDMSKVFCLYNHNWDNVLSRTDANTLSLKIDGKGLAFNCTLPNTTLGNDVFENVRNRNIQGVSFGFTVADDDWTDDDQQRLVKQIDQLFEISLTPIPAYDETSVKAIRNKNQLSKEKINLLNRISLIERIDNLDN
jgi:HK97 family phage prohead protease